MPVVVLILYLAGCVVCAVMGRNTTIGFVGHFILAALLTPLLDFLIQAVGRPSLDTRTKQRV